MNHPRNREKMIFLFDQIEISIDVPTANGNQKASFRVPTIKGINPRRVEIMARSVFTVMNAKLNEPVLKF